MNDERVTAVERDLWLGGDEVYRRRIADDCLMVLPEAPFVVSGQQAIRAVSKTPRWTNVEFAEFRAIRPQDGIIVVAYKATAQREEQSYVAYCTSTYRKFDQDEWKIIQHQQTVPLAGQE